MPRAPKAPGHAAPREPWRGSRRKRELSSEFERLRPVVLAEAGFRCQRLVLGERCTARATDVDHIVAGGLDVLDNLEALCSRHHDMKSGSEGARSARSDRFIRGS